MCPFIVEVFFMQAEGGIRDATVTGVQPCALPISVVPGLRLRRAAAARGDGRRSRAERRRSEERRVGKECRSRWSPCRLKKKEKRRTAAAEAPAQSQPSARRKLQSMAR